MLTELSTTSASTSTTASTIANETNAYLQSIYQQLGLGFSSDSWQYALASFSTLLLLAIASFLLARFILHFKITHIIVRTKSHWDDTCLEHNVFSRLAHLVPGIVLYLGKFVFIDSSADYFLVISQLISLYLIIAVYRLLSAILRAGEAIYSQSELSKKAPITGFVQVARLIFTLALIFLIISLLLGKSPIYLLSGLTAIAAVLLLIFRDTILGFVAGIQIAANRMFNTGDWIAIPKYDVDGDIIEIGLTVVKVQNWDKTISTIPTYALTSDAVKNWRGMQESGGRRIKRAVHIDMRSIQFANKAMVKDWQKLSLIDNYLKGKSTELEQDEARCQTAALDRINSRRLTNIGTFRAYVKAYLESHPDVHQDMTLLVRQLNPSEVGLPIEIYCFSKKQAWADYEHLQSEIFDHLLAILPIFKLTAYQRVANNAKRNIQLEIE
jgi:miniconductance mechanosensitive channel